jgi:transposase
MASWPCPECEASCQLYDHQGERQWRHLDTCQHQTILHARPPRTECSEHGVRVVKLRWAEPSSRFTAVMERLVLDWLRAASQKAAGEQLGLHGIMEGAVERTCFPNAVRVLKFRTGHDHSVANRTTLSAR